MTNSSFKQHLTTKDIKHDKQTVESTKHENSALEAFDEGCPAAIV